MQVIRSVLKTKGPPVSFLQLLSEQRCWVVVVILLFTGFIRLRLLDVPLERDEGEFAYVGQNILHGIPPYLQAYTMKLPGTHAAYALIMSLLGETVQGIHLGLLLVNVAIIILVFLLGRRLLDDYAGLVAAASYALLSVGQSVLGVFAHSEHFVTLAALGGMLLLLCAIDSGHRIVYLGSGVLMGLSFLMKQHAVFFLFFSLLYLMWSMWGMSSIQRTRLRVGMGIFVLGITIPFGLTCLAMFATGAFEKFWFWTVTYAGEYVSEIPFSYGMQLLSFEATNAATPAYPLWLLAGVGLVAQGWDKRIRRYRMFVVGFCLFSFLAICPGFYFRNHYFLLVLPAVALLAGIAVSSGRLLLSKHIAASASSVVLVLLFMAAFGYTVYREKAFLFELSPYEVSRLTYGSNPFPESLEIAKYIKDHTTDHDRIAVLGSEPQIYFYAQRPSATGYIYTYGLLEPQPYALRMQQEMVQEIEQAHPEYLVFVDVPWSWLVRPTSEKMIVDWARKYIAAEYTEVGFIDISPTGPTRFLWDSEAVNYVPRSSNVAVLVYKRKSLPRT